MHCERWIHRQQCEGAFEWDGSIAKVQTVREDWRTWMHPEILEDIWQEHRKANSELAH